MNRSCHRWTEPPPPWRRALEEVPHLSHEQIVPLSGAADRNFNRASRIVTDRALKGFSDWAERPGSLGGLRKAEAPPNERGSSRRGSSNLHLRRFDKRPSKALD
eukprot:3553249-Pyramimonas_sp.AAC.1